jgi:hypothetical protein
MEEKLMELGVSTKIDSLPQMRCFYYGRIEKCIIK